jgi:hypothetical protein
VKAKGQKLNAKVADLQPSAFILQPWFVAVALVIVACEGCVSSTRTAPRPARGPLTVSLPEVLLMPMEYIQEVELDVLNGRVVSVNRLLDDWDSDVTWDNPGLVTASCHARHFSAGLSDTKVLAEFITIESTGDLPLVVKATLRTSSCDPTGRPDRTLQFSQTELTLKPASNGGKVK